MKSSGATRKFRSWGVPPPLRGLPWSDSKKRGRPPGIQSGSFATDWGQRAAYSRHRVAAADRDQLTGYLPRRLRRGEPQHGATDVLGGGEPSQRRVLEHEVDLVLVEDRILSDRPQAGGANRVGPVGDHQPGAYDVGSDAVAAVLARRGAGQCHHGGLRRTVDALPDLAECRVAGDEYDRAATNLFHDGYRRLGRGNRREQVDLNGALPLVPVGIGGDESRNAPAGIVH